LRTIRRDYRKVCRDWKLLLRDISEFLAGKVPIEREGIPPFDPALLRLVTIDFVS